VPLTRPVFVLGEEGGYEEVGCRCLPDFLEEMGRDGA
jgi:hypothetical protein